MRVKKDVEVFVKDAPQFDDMTMLCIKRNMINLKEMLEVQPDMQSLPCVKEFMTRQSKRLQVSDKQKSKLMIVVDEVYSNIIRYSGAKAASISIGRENEKLILEFLDDGIPYNPLESKDPDVHADLQDREIGGLGIFVVRKMVESAVYEYTNHQNKLTIVMKA